MMQLWLPRCARESMSTSASASSSLRVIFQNYQCVNYVYNYLLLCPVFYLEGKHVLLPNKSRNYVSPENQFEKCWRSCVLVLLHLFSCIELLFAKLLLHIVRVAVQDSSLFAYKSLYIYFCIYICIAQAKGMHRREAHNSNDCDSV